MFICHCRSKMATVHPQKLYCSKELKRHLLLASFPRSITDILLAGPMQSKAKPKSAQREKPRKFRSAPPEEYTILPSSSVHPDASTATTVAPSGMRSLHCLFVLVLVLLVSTALTVASLPLPLPQTQIQIDLQARKPFGSLEPHFQLSGNTRATSPEMSNRTFAPESTIIAARNNRFFQGLRAKLKKCVACGSNVGAGAGRRREGRAPAKGAVHPVFSPVHAHVQGQGQAQAPPPGGLHRQNRQDLNAFLDALEHIN